jgi:hypothetical protein
MSEDILPFNIRVNFWSVKICWPLTRQQFTDLGKVCKHRGLPPLRKKFRLTQLETVLSDQAAIADAFETDYPGISRVLRRLNQVVRESVSTYRASGESKNFELEMRA